MALPVGLELDESMVPEEFTMDESNMSQSLKLEDLTMMFGHHMTCSDDDIKRYSLKKSKRFPQADIISESECWSEPDRNVSLARVGLCDTGVSLRESTVELNKYKSRRGRVSYGSRSEGFRSGNETAVLEEFNQMTKQNQLLEQENKDLNNKLECSMKKINELMTENKELKANIAFERGNLIEVNKNVDAMKITIIALESKVKDFEEKYLESLQFAEKIRSERQELETTFMETERMLRRAADEATVQASQAALERARAQHERLRIERELEDTREKLAVIMETNSQLEIELSQKKAADADNNVAAALDLLHSEEDRPTSPDQGIDSDRLSSLEQNDALSLSPRTYHFFRSLIRFT